MYVCTYFLPPCFPLSLHRCSGAYSHQLLQVVKLNLRNYTYQYTFRSLYTINQLIPLFFKNIFHTSHSVFLLILSTLAMHALDPTKSVESHCKFLHALTWPYTPFLLQIGS